MLVRPSGTLHGEEAKSLEDHGQPMAQPAGAAPWPDPGGQFHTLGAGFPWLGAGTFPIFQLPIGQEVPFQKPHGYAPKTPSPVHQQHPPPIQALMGRIRALVPSSPGDAAPSSACTGRVWPPCRALAPTTPHCCLARAPRLIPSLPSGWVFAAPRCESKPGFA